MIKKSTLFLKISVIFIGIPVAIFCILGMIDFIKKGPINPDYALILYPMFISIYVSAIPFYYALYQTFKLLNYIDENKAFSEVSVFALRKIKSGAFIISLIFILVMPCFYLFAEKDDAPGVLLINLIIVFASLFIGFLTLILQRLLSEAITMKQENELTI